MKGHWFDLVATAGFAALGCAVIYAIVVRALRRVIAEQKEDTDRQLSALAMTVKALQVRVAELGVETARPAAVEAAAGVAERTEGQEVGQIEPQTLAAISAAATAYLGKKARIRSARALPAAQDTVDAWAQQGRVFVQTSHNPRPRG